MAASNAVTERRSGARAAVGPAAVFLLYSAITACFWLPAGNRFARQFVGDGGDNFVFVWNPWWLTRCIATGHNPYFCDMQFAPTGVPLAFHCLTFIPSLAIAALARFVSTPLAYNLVAVGLLPLAGLCAFALARHVTRDAAGAVVAGVAFMLCPFMTSKLLGHLNLSCAALLPLFVLCMFQAVEARHARWRTWLTVVYVVIVFCNEHTLIFAANVTVWYWLFRAIRSRQWRDETRRFWWAFKPAAIFSVAWGAFLFSYAVRYESYPYRTGGLAFAAEPLSFLLPLHRLSIWRNYIAMPGKLGDDLSNVELSVYLGWLVLPLAVAGFWCRRKEPVIRFMTLLLVCAAVLAMGHKLQWHREVVRLGGHGIRLPMALYRHIPVLGDVGQAGRYMVIGYMALAVGVAAAVAYIRERFGRVTGTWVAALVVVAICLDYGYRPVSVDPPVCAIPPGAGRVMEPRFEPARALYRQTRHERPLVGGYMSRLPQGLWASYEATPGLGWFFRRPGQRGSPPPPADIRNALRRWDIEYVCVPSDSEDRQVLQAAGLRAVYEDPLDVTLIWPSLNTRNTAPR